MILIPIFVNNDTHEGLYAVQYDGQKENEFARLLDQWTDAQFVRKYLTKNEEYLKSSFFNGYKKVDLILKIVAEARELQGLFLDFEQTFIENNGKLQELFRPLHNYQHTIPIHQETKNSIENWKNKKAILRFYAIRIGANCYVITGGAIKLTHKMEEHADTKRELEKMLEVKGFLASIELITDDDLNFFVL